ncbi:DUF4352 domain-containing protein [Alkalihalobacillus sp. FSL R5-0424]
MNLNKTGVAVLLVSVGILSACGDNADQSSDDMTTSGSEQRDTDETGSDEGLTEKRNSDSREDSDQTDTNLGEGSTEDQVDLQIGDTGVVETSISDYEVTLHSIEFRDELNGQSTDLDTFVIANVTIKNIGDSLIDIKDSLNVFEISTGIDDGGYWETSEHYDGFEEFTGELEPGEEKNGDLLFDDLEGEEHYLKVRKGLIAAGGVKNEVTWTFTEGDEE